MKNKNCEVKSYIIPDEITISSRDHDAIVSCLKMYDEVLAPKIVKRDDTARGVKSKNRSLDRFK